MAVKFFCGAPVGLFEHYGRWSLMPDVFLYEFYGQPDTYIPVSAMRVATQLLPANPIGITLWLIASAPLHPSLS